MRILRTLFLILYITFIFLISSVYYTYYKNGTKNQMITSTWVDFNLCKNHNEKPVLFNDIM